MRKINLLDLYAQITLEDSDFRRGLSRAVKSAKDFGGKISGTFAVAGKAIGGVSAAFSAVAGAGVVALGSLAESTEEYRIAMGKLQTAYDAAGMGQEAANTAYTEFYKILGDTDTATEASQLLAQLAESEEDLTNWTNIAAGVSGTFGDSLPIESLIEATNETVKVGQVTGTLADALNWVGISEDDFNAKLAACSTESERNQLIMETLSGTYEDAAAAFYANNEAMVKARENQALLDESLGKIGTAVTNVKNNLVDDFLPSIQTFSEALANLLNGEQVDPQALEQGIQQFQGSFATTLDNILNMAVAILPQVGEMAITIIVTLVEGIISKLPDVISAAVQIITSLVEGIASALPQLVPAAIGAVIKIVETLTNPDTLGNLIDAAISMIMALGEGLIDAIPRLVEKIPIIIQNLLVAVTQNLPKLMAMGIKLVVELGVGLIKAIPELIKAIPEIISALITAFAEGVKSFAQIGGQFLMGLWNGIKDKIGWLKGKVKGVVDTIKGWFTSKDGFDTHSPSKWAEKIGGYVSLGLAQGIEGNLSEVQKAAKETAKAVYDTQTKWAEESIKSEKLSLKEQLDIYRTIQSQFIEESEEWLKAEDKITTLRTSLHEEYYKNVQSIGQKIIGLEEDYQKQLEERSQSIYNSYSLFDATPEKQQINGQQLIDNLAGQIQSIESFYNNLEELASRGINSDLVDEIRAMGVDAADELNALLALSDKKLTEYSDLYGEKQELANTLALTELENFRSETDKQIMDNLQSISNLYQENAPLLGETFIESLVKGMEDNYGKLLSATQSIANDTMQTAGSIFGVSGFNMMPAMGTMNSSGAFAMNKTQSSENITLNITTELDGQTLARQLYTYTQNENNRRGSSFVTV